MGDWMDGKSHSRSLSYREQLQKSRQEVSSNELSFEESASLYAEKVESEIKSSILAFSKDIVLDLILLAIQNQDLATIDNAFKWFEDLRKQGDNFAVETPYKLSVDNWNFDSKLSIQNLYRYYYLYVGD